MRHASGGLISIFVFDILQLHPLAVVLQWSRSSHGESVCLVMSPLTRHGCFSVCTAGRSGKYLAEYAYVMMSQYQTMVAVLRVGKVQIG